MPTYTISAPAKINLFLDVLGVLENGYHELDTIMQSVSLCDIITFDTDADSLTVECSDSTLDGESNLAYRAAELFCERTSTEKKFRIQIEKHIPIAAGMAGGSSDAAAVLYALNDICGRPLTYSELCEIAVKIGADVTFCILGGSMRCGGIGEELTPISPLPDCAILVAMSDEKISAKDAYKKLDAEGFVPRENKVAEALERGDLQSAAVSMFNVFERTAPNSVKVKEMLLECGATGALMSGSGPTVFGVFDSDEAARNAAKMLKAQGIESNICRPIDGRISYN